MRKLSDIAKFIVKQGTHNGEHKTISRKTEIGLSFEKQSEIVYGFSKEITKEHSPLFKQLDPVMKYFIL